MYSQRRLRSLDRHLAPAAAEEMTEESSDDPNVVVPTELQLKQSAQLASDGYVLLEKALPPEKVAEIIEVIDQMPLDDPHGDMLAVLSTGEQVKSLRNPWNRSASFVQFLDMDPAAVVAENVRAMCHAPTPSLAPCSDGRARFTAASCRRLSALAPVRVERARHHTTTMLSAWWPPPRAAGTTTRRRRPVGI